MALIAAGNRRAFETLYDRYFDKLRWFAQGFLKDEAASEDIIQEVFLQIMRPNNGFDTTKTFSSWCYTLVANRCKNTLRDELNRQRILQENPQESEADNLNLLRDLDSKLMSHHIQTLMAKKSDKEKELYRLRFEHDLSIKEMAEILQIPEGSVKSGLYYLLKKLSEPLKQLIDERS